MPNTVTNDQMLDMKSSAKPMKNQSRKGSQYKCKVCGGPKSAHVCQPTMEKAKGFVKTVIAGTNNDVHDILTFIGYSIKFETFRGQNG